MFIIDDENKIQMVQGDTGSIRLTLENYKLSYGDKVIFAMTSRKLKRLLIEKSITKFESDGTALIILNGKDTVDITPGSYLYEIQVITKDGRIDTVIPMTKIKIMEGMIYER